jgi:hypothetical protein
MLRGRVTGKLGRNGWRHRGLLMMCSETAKGESKDSQNGRFRGFQRFAPGAAWKDGIKALLNNKYSMRDWGRKGEQLFPGSSTSRNLRHINGLAIYVPHIIQSQHAFTPHLV